MTSPVYTVFAQQFLPAELWVPFFNFVGFVIGTYVNAHTKKKRLQALRRKYQEGGRGRRNGVVPPAERRRAVRAGILWHEHEHQVRRGFIPL